MRASASPGWVMSNEKTSVFCIERKIIQNTWVRAWKWWRDLGNYLQGVSNNRHSWKRKLVQMLCFQVVFPYVYITWTRGRLTKSLKRESAPCWLTKVSPCIPPSSVVRTAHISLCVEIQHSTCFYSTTTSWIKLWVLSCQTAGRQEEGRRISINDVIIDAWIPKYNQS